MSAYLELIEVWNQKMNLVCYHGFEELCKRHLLDSLQCIRAVEGSESMRLLDIGSGAGFPGLPLAIVKPDWRVNLLESIKKKAFFLQEVVKKLELGQVTIINGRAEVIAHEDRERASYDLVTVRAVAALSVILELALPFLRKGGRLIAMKGPEPVEEIKEAEYALAILGGSYERTIAYQIEEQVARTIIVIKKVSDTPEKYPRREGLPAKRPLIKGVR